MARLSKAQRIRLWLDRLHRFAESDLTVAKFCEREKISLPTFYQWKRRLTPRVESPRQKRSRRSKKQCRQPSTTASSNGLSGFNELVIKAASTTAQVQLPGGITISLGDQSEMAQLIVDRLLHHAVQPTGDRERAGSC